MAQCTFTYSCFLFKYLLLPPSYIIVIGTTVCDKKIPANELISSIAVVLYSCIVRESYTEPASPTVQASS